MSAPSWPSLAVLVQVSNDRTPCAVFPSGEIRCWGGDPVKTARLVAAVHDAVEVRSGEHETCARTRTGAVVCVSDGGVTTPLSPSWDDERAVQLAVGGQFACALLANGRVRCWGQNGAGQLGDGTHTGSRRAVPVKDVDDAVEIVAADDFACARLRDGAVRCWGELTYRVPTDARGMLSAPHDITAMVADRFTLCVLRRGGAIQCWDFGRAKEAMLVQNAAQLVGGTNQGCARSTDGTARCWGWLPNGRIAISPRRPALLPWDRVSDITLGAAGVCGRRSDGDFVCLDGGSAKNPEGERGWPRRWAEGVEQVAVSPSRRCFRHANKTVRCGETWRAGEEMTPHDVELTDVADIALGQGHACALRGDGTLWCWGDNTAGQIGDGTLAARERPTRVTGLTDITSTALGLRHTCAIAHGQIACWGDNAYGQLGDGTTAGRASPAPVPGIVDAIQVVAGEAHTCALLRGGAVRCWGANESGELGDGTTQDRWIPVEVSNLGLATTIAAGPYRTCATLTDGHIACWGGTPGRVDGITGAVAVALGDEHACALLRDGNVACWGRGELGQIGAVLGTSQIPMPGARGCEPQSTVEVARKTTSTPLPVSWMSGSSTSASASPW